MRQVNFLSATSEMTRAIVVAVGMSVLSHVTIVWLGVWLDRSGVATVSIPPGRTIIISRFPVGIMGSRLVIVTTLIGHEQVFIFVYFVTSPLPAALPVTCPTATTASKISC